MIKKLVALQLGLDIRKASRIFKMRLANDQISGDVIDTVVQDCSASALNGEVQVTISELLITGSLPDCDMIMGRDVIFGLLCGVMGCVSLV